MPHPRAGIDPAIAQIEPAAAEPVGAAAAWLAITTVRPDGEAAQTVQHVALGGWIQMRGGFVQQQQRRILQEGAGDRHPLRLARPTGRSRPPPPRVSKPIRQVIGEHG